MVQSKKHDAQIKGSSTFLLAEKVQEWRFSSSTKFTHKTVSTDRPPYDEIFLKEKLKSDPTSWETRRQLAHGLYEKQAYEEAAEMIWTTEEIPSTDLDLAFAIHILAKAQPRRAIRLLTAVLELNQGKAVQNMAMANALLHHGMVLQAARFYGAALDSDPTLVNPDLEHFILWSDDECTMWGLFGKNRPELGELPWMARDAREALDPSSQVSFHNSPIYVPDIPVVAGEELKHDLYRQESTFNAKITPPPAITIPSEPVEPKDRLLDADYAASVISSEDAPLPSPPKAEEPVAPVNLPTPIVPPAPSSFPSSVVFPESAPRTVPVAPVLPVFTPLPAAEPAATFTPSATPVFGKQPEPAEDSFFADPVPPAATPLTAAIPAFIDPTPPAAVSFFADPISPSEEPSTTAAPSYLDPVPAATPLTAAVPFFVEPTPPAATPLTAAVPAFISPEPFAATPVTAAVPFFDAPAPTSLPPIVTENTVFNVPKADEDDALGSGSSRVSQSALPTTVLRVKWSTPPSKPGESEMAPPVSRPIAPPIPPAFQKSGPNTSEVTEEDSEPAGLPFIASGPPAPEPFLSAEAPSRPPIPSSTPPPKPPASLLRRLFSSGQPPANDDEQ